MLVLIFFFAINTLLYAVSVRAFFLNTNTLFLIVSTSWYFIIICGTFILLWNLGPPYNLDPLYGGTIIMVALTASDFFLAKRRYSELETTPRLEVLFSLVAAIITLGLISFHLYKADAIPAFQLTELNLSTDAIANERWKFTKELDAHRIVKMSFNWISTIFLPIVSYVLLKKRYLFTFAVYFSGVLIYSLLSLAKFPAFFSIVIVCLLALTIFRPEFEKKAIVAIIVSMIMANGLAVWKITDLRSYASQIPALENSENHSTKDKNRAANLPRFTPTDILHMPNSVPPPTVNKYVDYFLYRVFLIPPDVALRWYNYYGNMGKEPKGFREIYPLIFGNKGFQHASNKVGIWAYHARFPRKYKNYANAYSSADADAYSFGGLTAVLIVAALIFLMRVVPLFMIHTELGYLCFFIIQVSLAAMLFQASVQAIIISQGMFIAFGVLGLIWFFRVAKDRILDRRAKWTL